MTMPKKGSRRIVVDDEVYRWMVRGGDWWHVLEIVLTVEHESDQARQFQLFFTNFESHQLGGPIGPRVVAAAIRYMFSPERLAMANPPSFDPCEVFADELAHVQRNSRSERKGALKRQRDA